MNHVIESVSSRSDHTNQNLKSHLHDLLISATHILLEEAGKYPDQVDLHLSVGDDILELPEQDHPEASKSICLCQSFFSHTPTPISDLKMINDLLANKGQLIIQEVNFCEINGLPFNYALGRFKNIYKEVNTIFGLNARIGMSLNNLLFDSGFSEIKCSYLPPTYLMIPQRALILFLFERISKIATERGIIVEDEKIAINAEISGYLQEEKNLVNLPGVYQFVATKQTA